MGVIRTLDYNTVVKIAAGEVIDRPASIVRELIDNSIDAGAGMIRVGVMGGGKDMIEVYDDGCGMERDDLAVCYKNHTTSKIADFDDIMNLRTLGFRGEALSSIAEVAELAVGSRARDTISGNRLEVAYGKEVSLIEAGMSNGTSVVVKNLFGNLPARRKFLSSDSAETRFVNLEIIKKALAFYETGFEFMSGGERKYLASPRKTLLERVAEFFPDTLNYLIPIEHFEGGIAITGYITMPAFIRPNRSYQYFFVNRRAVEWKHFSFSIQHTYGNLVPKGFFPAAFLYLELDPSEADFNVHPMKKEVRFREEQAVAKILRRAVSENLTDFGSVAPAEEGEIRFTPYEQKIAGAIRTFLDKEESPRREYSSFPPAASGGEETEADKSVETPAPNEGLFGAEPVTLQEKAEIRDYRFIGILFSTYILLEDGAQVIFVDQHAAHERINYELMRDRYRAKDAPSQELLVPLKIDVPLKAADVMNESLGTLDAMGFGIEHFGGNTFIIRSVPGYIEYEDAEAAVNGFVDKLAENPDSDVHSADFIDSAIKQMACKASVRAGEGLTREEADELMDRLSRTERPFSCPHGRPVMFSLSKIELEKRFKRLGF
ncbi:MAG: hypothetical protein A2Y33_15635 [Spirochaetes bacterium GWF1_51_8]|nr:MAG: hypothetical protein A2Y33_15635 [Spirochaetes bacterium GWF1_51_8]